MHTPTIPTVEQMFGSQSREPRARPAGPLFEDMMQDCRERIAGLGPTTDPPPVPVLTSHPLLE